MVCHSGIVLSNVKPDGDQIHFGLGGLSKNRHVYWLFSSRRFLAACLIASMDSY